MESLRQFRAARPLGEQLFNPCTSPHETSRQIGTPALRAKIARDSLGTESRNEAGRTVIRNPCEESEFCQSQGNSRQGRLVCPFPYTSETLPTVPKRSRIP